jgi:flagellar basal-body rod protein FlgB
MAINFQSALSLHPQALALREKRSEILAANMANADTPDYKARDLDFKAALNQQLSAQSNPNQTRQGHQSSINSVLGADLLYRNPFSPSLDGNTVEANVEQAKYAENAVQYQASLRFVNDHFSGLMTAIRGD